MQLLPVIEGSELVLVGGLKKSLLADGSKNVQHLKRTPVHQRTGWCQSTRPIAVIHNNIVGDGYRLE